jgi:hypothetical protein
MYPKVHLGTQKNANNPSNMEHGTKRAKLELSQYLISDYITEPQQIK